jgi:hypothetical protein
VRLALLPLAQLAFWPAVLAQASLRLVLVFQPVRRQQILL